jgi:hypothetical protein
VKGRLSQPRPSIELDPLPSAGGRFGAVATENTIVVGSSMPQLSNAKIVGRHPRSVLTDPAV